MHIWYEYELEASWYSIERDVACGVGSGWMCINKNNCVLPVFDLINTDRNEMSCTILHTFSVPALKAQMNF